MYGHNVVESHLQKFSNKTDSVLNNSVVLRCNKCGCGEPVSQNEIAKFIDVDAYFCDSCAEVMLDELMSVD